jgi:hypothetical protein
MAGLRPGQPAGAGHSANEMPSRHRRPKRISRARRRSRTGWPGRCPAMVELCAAHVPRITGRNRTPGTAPPDQCRVNQVVESKRKLRAGGRATPRQRHRTVQLTICFCLNFYKNAPGSWSGPGVTQRIAIVPDCPCGSISSVQSFRLRGEKGSRGAIKNLH